MRTAMATLRIHDLNQQVLAIDLHSLLDLLTPRSLEANWTVSTVKSGAPDHEWFDATGRGGEELEKWIETHATLSGAALYALAKETTQVI
jgi:hypothetical protein